MLDWVHIEINSGFTRKVVLPVMQVCLLVTSHQHLVVLNLSLCQHLQSEVRGTNGSKPLAIPGSSECLHGDLWRICLFVFRILVRSATCIIFFLYYILYIVFVLDCFILHSCQINSIIEIHIQRTPFTDMVVNHVCLQ